MKQLFLTVIMALTVISVTNVYAETDLQKLIDAGCIADYSNVNLFEESYSAAVDKLTVGPLGNVTFNVTYTPTNEEPIYTTYGTTQYFCVEEISTGNFIVTDVTSSDNEQSDYEKILTIEESWNVGTYRLYYLDTGISEPRGGGTLEILTHQEEVTITVKDQYNYDVYEDSHIPTILQIDNITPKIGDSLVITCEVDLNEPNFDYVLSYLSVYIVEPDNNRTYTELTDRDYLMATGVDYTVEKAGDYYISCLFIDGTLTWVQSDYIEFTVAEIEYYTYSLYEKSLPAILTMNNTNPSLGETVHISCIFDESQTNEEYTNEYLEIWWLDNNLNGEQDYIELAYTEETMASGVDYTFNEENLDYHISCRFTGDDYKWVESAYMEFTVVQ